MLEQQPEAKISPEVSPRGAHELSSMPHPEHSLLKLSVPELVQSQLDKITRESIRAREVGEFDPHKAKEMLKQKVGQRVIAVDMGGGTFRAATLEVDSTGKLKPAEGEDPITVLNKNGAGFLPELEAVAKKAAEAGLPVGVSTAGIVKDTQLVESPNLPTFVDDLKAKYVGDLRNLFTGSTLAVANDAIAGLMSGAVAAADEFPDTQNYLYEINGGGYGQAVLVDGRMYATEVGHFPVVSELNPYHQERPCGLEGQQFTCIEVIAGSGAGIEDIYEQQTGEHLDGREISYRYQEGDKLARSLYDNSAQLIAHGIVGTGKVFGILDTPDAVDKTAVVAHGGGFRVPDYGERVKQILDKNLGKKTHMLVLPGNHNACLEGAAIAALTTPATTGTPTQSTEQR